MTQCPIGDIFVETKMTPRGAKFRNLETPDTLKLCLKREKPIFFNKQIIQGSFLSIARVQVSGSKQPPSTTLIECLLQGQTLK